jgi:hypothetical protein
MIVSVRDIAARCKGCGGTDFRKVNGAGDRLASVMACTGCGRETTYRDLLESIGEEAMRRANDALEKLRKNSGRGRKPRK